MSLLVAVRPCILHEGIAYCPRSGHVLNLDYAVEYLLSRIAHHTFIKGYKVETPVFLQVTFNEDATVTNCDFSRDVRPAKYLQYTCDLLYPSISLDFLSTSAICNFEYRQRAGGRTTQYTVEELRSEAVVDYTYWGSDHTTPNMICVSTLGVYGAALRKLGNASDAKHEKKA
ncbi:hypothetical protein SprV_0401464700 [Sparganum proliferum]